MWSWKGCWESDAVLKTSNFEGALLRRKNVDCDIIPEIDAIPSVKPSKMYAPSKGELNVADRRGDAEIFVGDVILNACLRIHFELDGLYWWS